MELFLLFQLLLVLLIVLGLLTSFEDITKGYISNAHLLLFSIFGFVINTFLLFKYSNSINYLIYYFATIFIGIIIGFTLYLIDFWSAGDGKLLMAYSFVFPFSFLLDNQVSFYMFHLVLLVNIFIPYFMICLIKANYCSTFHKQKKLKKRDVLNIIDEFLFIFVLTWISRIILNGLSAILGKWIVQYSFVFVFLISTFFIFILTKMSTLGVFNSNSLYKSDNQNNNKNLTQFSKDKRFSTLINLFSNLKLRDLALFVLFILGLYFQKERLFDIAYWLNFIVFYVLLSIFRKHLQKETIEYFTKKVHILKLKSDMVLRDYVVLVNGEEKVKKSGRKSFFVKEKGMVVKKRITKSDQVSFSGSLSSEDVFLLNKLYKSNSLNFKELEIQSMIPFAPLMFFGVILTLVLSGSMIFLFF